MATRSGTHSLRRHPSICLPAQVSGCRPGLHHPLHYRAASWQRLRRERSAVCLSTDSMEPPGPAAPKRARRKVRNANSADLGAQLPGVTPSPPDDRNRVLADPPVPTIPQPPRPGRRSTAKTPAPVQGSEVTPPAADGQGAGLPDPALAPTPQPAGRRKGGKSKMEAAAQTSDGLPAAPLGPPGVKTARRGPGDAAETGVPGHESEVTPPAPETPDAPANNPIPTTPRPSRRSRGGTAKGVEAAQGLHGTPSTPDSIDATSAPLDRCDILNQRCMQLLGVELKPSESVRKMINQQPADSSITNLEGMHEELGPELTRVILEKRPLAVVGSCKTLTARVQGIKQVLCDGNDDDLAKVLRKLPLVLSFQPATLEQKVQDASKLLDLSRKDAVRWLLDSDTALSYSSDTLVGKVADFSSVLGLDRAECCKVLRRQQVYMGLTRDTVQAKFTALSALLGGEDEARKAVIKANSILRSSPENHRAKLQALAALFGPTKALQMLRAVPALLGFSSDVLASKWESLKRLGAQVPRWDAELRNISASCLATSFTYSQKRHLRLEALIEAGAAETWALYSTLNATPEDFQAKLERTVGRRWVEDVWHGRLGQPDVLADDKQGIPDQ